MNPALKKFLPWIIGLAVTLLLFVLLISGAGEAAMKGLLALLGIGATAKAGHTVLKARTTITESTEEHAETTTALNENQAERAAADAAAVAAADADPGPDTTVPEDDERERLRAAMDAVKLGKRRPPST